MARATQYQVFMPWSGGLVSSVDPFIANPDTLQQADNIEFTTSGSRRKRGGQARFNTATLSVSTANTLVKLVDYWATVSNVKKPSAVAIASEASTSTAAAVFRSVEWSSSNFNQFNSAGLKVTHGKVTTTVFNNDLIVGAEGNGTNSLRVWADQGTTALLVNMTAASGTLPGRGWIVQENKRRLWVAGDASEPDKLYYSAVGDREAWAGTGADRGGNIIIGTENDKDPQGITAIIPGIGGDSAIYIAKRNSIYRLDTSALDPSNWGVSLLTQGIGVINPNAWTAVDQADVVFASDRGIHSLLQVISGTEVREGDFLSAPIHTDYQDKLDATFRDRFVVRWFPPLNSILVGTKLSSRSSMDTVYLYNIQLKQWYRWTGVPCNDLLVRFNEDNSKFELYAVGQLNGANGDRGFINQLNQTTKNDFDSCFQTTIKSQIIYPNGDYLFEKHFTGLGFIYKSRDNKPFNVQYLIDQQSTGPALEFQQKSLGGFILGSSTLGVGVLGDSPLGIKPNIKHIAGVGHSIEVTITHDEEDSDLDIFGMLIEYQQSEESQDAFRKL